jgi:hypothetical protein
LIPRFLKNWVTKKRQGGKANLKEHNVDLERSVGEVGWFFVIAGFLSPMNGAGGRQVLASQEPRAADGYVN